MSYPQNDRDFAEGTITWVKDDGGEMVLVGYRMNYWLHGPHEGSHLVPRIREFTYKQGMKIRIYAYQGIPERGVYIGGRVVKPHLSIEKAHDWVREMGCWTGRRAAVVIHTLP